MGKIISLVNPKGGSGKSTLSLCLAEVLKNCLIVDSDPQACLWNWYQERKSNPNLRKSRKEIQVDFYGLSELTRDYLEDAASRFDYVLIDCPGESEAGEKTRAALVFSDLVIIPVHGSDFDITSLLTHLAPLFEDAIAKNTRGGRIMFLPVFVHPFAKLDRVVSRFEGLGVEVIQAAFRTRQVLKVFSERGQTLSGFIKKGRFARDRLQAREVMINIREIAKQITFELEK